MSLWLLLYISDTKVAQKSKAVNGFWHSIMPLAVQDKELGKKEKSKNPALKKKSKSSTKGKTLSKKKLSKQKKESEIEEAEKIDKKAKSQEKKSISTS